LVERKGRWGEFFGCVKFPDCNGKKNIEKTKCDGKMPVRSGIPSSPNSSLGLGSKITSLPLERKDLEQQALQELLNEGQIQNVEDLVTYVASRGCPIT
jgi:hypothetical protein